MAWWQSALGIPQGEGGLLSDPRAMAGAQGLAGLTSTFGLLSAAFAPTTDPSQRGRILAGIGPAAQQAMRGARAGALEDERGRQVQAWRSRVASLPEDQRALYGALPPEAGAPLLLQDQRRQRALEDYDRLSAQQPAAPAAFPQAPVPPAGAAPAAAPAGGAMPPADLMPIFQRASMETGVPVPILMAQARQESNFNPNATGRAGEIGIGQIMPSTAQNPGFGVQPVDPARLRDPAENIMFQARYLAGRARAAGLTDWNNQEQVAAALRAYNGGGDPNYVQNVTRFLPPGAGQVQTSGGGGQMQPPAQAGGQAQGVDRLRQLARLAVATPELAPLVQAEFQLFQRSNPQYREARFDDGVYLVNERNPMERIRLGALPEGAPLAPERFRQERELREAGRTNVTQNADIRAENAEGAARGKSLAEEGDRVRLAAETGAATIDSIRYVRSLAANTGRLAPMQEAVGGWLDALGINSRLVRQAADLQAFQAAASQAILGRQLEQKGVQTDADAQRMAQTFAQIRNTPEGNEFILRAAEAQSSRAMERAEFYQRWRAERGTLDGAGEAWNRVIRETPLVYRGRDGSLTFLPEFLASAAANNVPREEALALWQRQAR